MLAAQWEGIETIGLVERPVPRAEPGQAVVEVIHCGICGSDLHSYHDGFAVRPGQVLGHEFSGRVIEAPGVEGLAPGQLVTARPLIPCGHCEACLAGEIQLCEAGSAGNIGYGLDGAFAERVLIPRATVGEVIFPIPDSVSERAAALVEPLAVSLHAVKQTCVRAGQAALVLGAGTIGLGAVSFLSRAGASPLIVADPSAMRRQAAEELGADLVVDPSEADAVAAVAALTGAGAGGYGARADLVIDCAGVPAALRDGVRAVRAGGTVVLCAMYGAKAELAVDTVTMKEAVLRGAIGYKHEFAAVIDALARGEVEAESLISHDLPLAEIEEAFRIQSDPSASLKVLVSP